MEPEVRTYLIRILNTMSLALLWMIVNTTAGIMFDYAFIHDSITTGNIIFYCWFIISFVALIWYFIKLWNKPLNIPR